MADVPRRLPPTAEERLRVAIERMIPGTAAGGTRFARRAGTDAAPTVRTVSSASSG